MPRASCSVPASVRVKSTTLEERRQQSSASTVQHHLAGLAACRSEFLALDEIGHASSRVLHDRFAWTTPDLLHGTQERLGLTRAIEFQVDHDVIGVLLEPKDLVTANPGSLTVRGIPVEGFLPLLEILDGVFNPHDGHLESPHK